MVCSVPFLGLAATRFFWIMKLCGIANLSWLSAGLVHAFLECKVSCKISSIFLWFIFSFPHLGSVVGLSASWPGQECSLVWCGFQYTCADQAVAVSMVRPWMVHRSSGDSSSGGLLGQVCVSTACSSCSLLAEMHG